MNDSTASILPTVDAHIYPRGGLDILSRDEVARLRDASAGGMHDLLRRCALAVLTSGSTSDDPRAAAELYPDFDIQVLQQDRGVRIDLFKAPAMAFVGGDIIRGVAELLFAVVRDLAYTAIELREGHDLYLFLGAAKVGCDDHRRAGRPVACEDGEGALDLVAALQRARIVEGDHEVALCSGLQPPFDDLPGRQQVGQRDTAEVVAYHGACLGGGGLEGGDAGNDIDRDARGLEIDDLVDQRCHGIDARIAGADEGHLLALLGKFNRMADAIFLTTKREAILGLVPLQIGNKIEIEAVAYPVGCQM